MGTVEWIVLLSVGVLAGLGLGFFLGRLGGRGNSQKLADAQAELEEYRQSVSEHFSRSAEHFQAIGRQYRELYEHMADGSEKLCVGAPSEGQLKFPRPDEVASESAAQDDAPPEPVKDTESAASDDDNALAEAAAPADDGEPDTATKSSAQASDDTDTRNDEEAEVVAMSDDAESSVAAQSGDSDTLDAPKAPSDYAEDDPKDRRYH